MFTEIFLLALINLLALAGLYLLTTETDSMVVYSFYFSYFAEKS